MKKLIAIALAGVLALSMAACGARSTETTATAAAAAAETAGAAAGAAKLSGTVTLAGSTSMQKLMSMLQEDFMAKNNGVTVSYDPTGSGAGITGASDGSLDIGLSSRVLHDDETDVEAITVCLDGIAVVVNNANDCYDIFRKL